MRLPFPRSLGGRLIVVLLVSIIASQVAAGILLVWDKDQAAVQLMHSQVIGQAISLRNLLMRSPAGERAALLEKSGLGSFCAVVSAQPAVPPPSTDAERAFVERLQVMLDGQLNDVPRVSILHEPVFAPGKLALPPCEAFADRVRSPHRPLALLTMAGSAGSAGPSSAAVSPGGHHRWAGLSIALPLGDGSWMTSYALVNLPPPWGRRIWISLVLLVVAVAGATVLTVGLATRPLRRLARAADRLGRGETVEPIPETGPGEIVSVVSAFNLMRERLTRFVEDRTRLLAAVSHDLRTPLTTLRLKASLTDDAEMAAEITHTVEEMQGIVDATLSFTHATHAEDARPVDVTSLVESVVDDLADLGQEVTMADGPRIDRVCHPSAIRRAVRNLVENAVRYGQRARVSVAEDRDGLVIAVEDDGPGIPPDKFAEVVKPFVRLEESRNASTGGIGLGLPIAKNVAHAHGGDLVLANRPEGGLRVELRLP